MRVNRKIQPLVTQDEWAVSCTTGDSINGAILHVHRVRVHGKNLSYPLVMRGNGDSRTFPSKEDAWQWAYDHGYLQLYFASPDLRMRRILSRMNQPAQFYPVAIDTAPK